MSSVVAAGAEPSPAGAFATGRYRNLFAEHLGRSEAELTAKIDATWRQFAEGDPATQQLFYTVPGEMTYVPDINNRDVRTEGQSYGMMLAVQLDRRAEFDRIWRWTKTHMLNRDGRFAGYFGWHCKSDGTKLSEGPASDGEEWFTMALFFAAHRWGKPAGGEFDYAAEAQALLKLMLHRAPNVPADDVTPMFDRVEKQIVFVPHGTGCRFTDPSYHLPAYYELWARWADDPRDRSFLADAAKVSRDHFRRAAHPVTGLMPDYAHFDGRPYVQHGHEDFRFDAYRTIANVALDWSWFARDPWQREQSDRVLAFLAAQGPRCPNQFTLDGKPLDPQHSPGLFAMAAVGALAADGENAKRFVQRLWEMPIPSGQERYYDGLLYFLGLLQAGGRFQIHAPQASSPASATR